MLIKLFENKAQRIIQDLLKINFSRLEYDTDPNYPPDDVLK